MTAETRQRPTENRPCAAFHITGSTEKDVGTNSAWASSRFLLRLGKKVNCQQNGRRNIGRQKGGNHEKNDRNRAADGGNVEDIKQGNQESDARKKQSQEFTGLPGEKALQEYQSDACENHEKMRMNFSPLPFIHWSKQLMKNRMDIEYALIVYIRWIDLFSQQNGRAMKFSYH